MAKRRKTRKTSRRRRIGALSLNASSPLVKFGSIALGYFLGDKINAKLDEVTGGKVDGKIIAGAEIGAGIMLMKSKGSSTLKAVAAGALLGAGAKKAMTEFGIISGFRSVPVVGGYKVPASLPAQMNGITDVPTVGGFTVPSSSANLVGGINQNDGLNQDNY